MQGSFVDLDLWEDFKYITAIQEGAWHGCQASSDVE